MVWLVKLRSVLGILPLRGGGSRIPKSKCQKGDKILTFLLKLNMVHHSQIFVRHYQIIVRNMVLVGKKNSWANICNNWENLLRKNLGQFRKIEEWSQNHLFW